MRATKYKHYSNACNKKSKDFKPKTNKKIKALFFVFSVSLTVALIVPTTTLAPSVDAFVYSKEASYSTDDTADFSSLITDNRVAETTVPDTQQKTETTEKATTKSKETEPSTAETTKSDDVKVTETKVTKASEPKEENTESEYIINNEKAYDSQEYLLEIDNPDSSYAPDHTSLSSYDREKLERLVMGEAGSMGYAGAALVAQSIRDAMNQLNTASIDTIISEYQYYGSIKIKPNKTVKDAVSYIFDQNGSAVQHRILFFYTGSSSWHETQQFILCYGKVKFFDSWN